MSTAHPNNVFQSSRIVHLIGCVLGTVLLLLYVALAVGAGPPPLSLGSVALTLMFVGFIVAWWRDVVGGVLSLVGIGSFYAWNLADAGTLPAGWVLPLCFLPGVLQLIAWLLRLPVKLSL
jgi:hypothetical protein